jgi:methylphosphotriester-DNA--protein-cysteine methyltransferase
MTPYHRARRQRAEASRQERKARLIAALELMDAGQTVEAAAFRAGFGGQPAFSKMLHRWTGRWPSEVRNGAWREVLT